MVMGNKKMTAFAVAVSMMVPYVSPIMAQEEIFNGTTFENENAVINFNISGTSVNYPSKEQIAAFKMLYDLGENDISSSIYTSEPVFNVGSMNAGSLADEVQQKALNTVNYIRYIAGLTYDIQLNDEFINLAQHASFVNA